MLEFILGAEFTFLYLVVIAAIVVFGVLRLRGGFQLFAAMVAEFRRFAPEEHSSDSFAEYKRSVFEFASRSSVKTCGMWSSFLDEVHMASGAQGAVAETSAEAVDRLRDNLLFAYSTSHKASRINTAVISGVGFIGTLIAICAGTLAAEPFLQGSGQFEQALSALLSGGGLAFLSAAVGILGAVLFGAFERSQLESVEQRIDDLISYLRQRIVFRTEKSYLSEIQNHLVHSSERVHRIVQEIGDRVVELKDNQMSASAIEDSSRELSRDLTQAMEAVSGRIVDAISSTHAEAQRLREEQSLAARDLSGAVAVLTTTAQEQSAKEEVWWEQALGALQRQVDWSERQHASLERMEQQLSASASREDKMIATLEAITRGISELDESLEEDVDHLVEQNRETQMALMHYLNDTLEVHLSGILEQLRKSGDEDLKQNETLRNTFELAVENVRAAVERQTDTEKEYLTHIKAALDTGLETVKAAIDASTADRRETNNLLIQLLEESNQTRYMEMDETRRREEERRQRESERDARNESYWKKQIALHEEDAENGRRILEEQQRAQAEERDRAERDERAYREKLAQLREGRVPVDFGDAPDADSGERDAHADDLARKALVAPLDLSALRAAIARSREAVEGAARNFQIVGEQSDYLTKSCHNIIREMNRMNDDLLDQTESRLNRYGKAYQPLAESNLLICELLTRAIKDVGGIKRAVDFDHSKLVELIKEPAVRISELESSLSDRERSGLLTAAQVAELEGWWAQTKSTNVIEAFGNQIKSDTAASARVYIQAQEHAGELKKMVDHLKNLIEIGILDQVTNWPAVLDQARVVRDSSRRLAGLEKKLARTQQRSDEDFVKALGDISQALDRSETLLLNAEAREESSQARSRKTV